jgi:hypothetical protein
VFYRLLMKVLIHPNNNNKGFIFCPHDYGALTLSSHELPTMTLDPIKLPSDDTFLPFVSGQSTERFFFSWRV